jgi:hypothetical protein
MPAKKNIKTPEGDTRKKSKSKNDSESKKTSKSIKSENKKEPDTETEIKTVDSEVLQDKTSIPDPTTSLTENSVSTLKIKPEKKPDVSDVTEVLELDSTSKSTESEPVLKKRGRRPKPKVEEPVPPPQPSIITKKKGKNPKESYGLNENYEEEDPFFNNVEPEINKCIETPIMRLNVTVNDIKKIKDPNFNIDESSDIPSAFNTNDGFSYVQNTGTLPPKDTNNGITDEDIQKYRNNRDKELENVDSNNESKLLNQFIEHNKKETWPEKSVYDCMWCRFPFENTPWAIPYRLTMQGKFEVFGNFCSPNCSAAYIFNSFDDDDMWDRYALLNMLYQKVYDLPGAVVKAAPDVLFLKKLGGILSIEEFREISSNPNKSCFIKMPPMVSIIPSVEELQQTSLFNDNNREHLNKELMMKANDELRLRRSKPVYDKDNTLDNYFHIPKNVPHT